MSIMLAAPGLFLPSPKDVGQNLFKFLVDACKQRFVEGFDAKSFCPFSFLKRTLE